MGDPSDHGIDANDGESEAPPPDSTLGTGSIQEATAIPRADEPSKPPAGTIETPYLRSDGFKQAVVATFVFVSFIARPFLIARFGEAGAVLAEGAAAVWLASWGFKSPDSLRYK